MESRKLTNDALGAKGEARFKELCEDAGLIANKAGRDMMGWDYIVERPLEGDDDLPLDRRVQGCVCRIQIKTIWERDAGRVSLSLSACEVLAKTADPALICTFVVNDELEFTSASLIHIFDDKLARVLKRLRVASTEVDGKGLNEREITFGTADAGEIFKLTGKALKARLAEICGADPKEYRQKKEKQLTDLGYEERARYELKTKFQVSSHEEIVDFLLGKKPIELLEAQSIDNRFGVPIPTSQISVKAGIRATLTLRPTSTVECRIRVRPAGGKGTPATFRGVVETAPFRQIPVEHQKIIFRTSLFHIEMGNKQIAFSTDGNAINASILNLDEWGHVFRLIRYIGQGTLLVEIAGEAPNSPKQELTVNTPLNQELGDYGTYLENVASMASWLCSESGVLDLKLSKEQIEDAADTVEMAYLQMSGKIDEKLSFTSGVSDEGTMPPRLAMLLLGQLAIGQAHLCFAKLIDFTPSERGSEVTWTETRNTPVRLAEFDGTDAGFSDFGEKMVAETGADGTMLISNHHAHSDSQRP